MPWSVTASGHSPDQVSEGSFLNEVTEALADPKAGLKVLHIVTEHFGHLGLDDLRHTPADVDEEEA